MRHSHGRRLLELLWDGYVREVPYARTYADLQGRSFQNDHIALRALSRSGGGVELFSAVFERLGWKPAGTLSFPETHLSAVYLTHPEKLPRVFLSELQLEKLSPAAQQLLDRVPP